MKLRTSIDGTGGNTAGIVVPEADVTALGGGKRPKVAITLNGYTYRASISPMAGRYLAPVSADVRSKAGVKAGDIVDVEIVLDTAPREIAVPADLAAALTDDPAAHAAFEGLSYSNKRRLVEPIEAAKAPETRARRIVKTVASLRDGEA